MALPQIVYDSPDFIGLSAKAIKLLVDMAVQFNGHNNGALTASMAYMKQRGWNSNRALNSALSELLDARMVIRTREGRFRPRIAALYAITWRAIDECQGQYLDVPPTRTPPVKFSIEQSGNVVRLKKK